MPYDTEDKPPTKHILARLTDAPIPTESSPGQGWAPTAQIIPSQDQPSRIEAYKNAFDKAAANPFVKKFWRKTITTEAGELMDALYKGKGIGNAANGKPIAADLVIPS